jgi:hypothetical protein
LLQVGNRPVGNEQKNNCQKNDQAWAKPIATIGSRDGEIPRNMRVSRACCTGCSDLLAAAAALPAKNKGVIYLENFDWPDL